MEAGREFPGYLSRRPPKGQEALSLFFKPEIPQEYSLERAEAAAARRHQRRGELKLNARTRNFMKNVDDLWTPAYNGEITLVIKSLEGEIMRGRLQAKWRVEEKWQDSGRPSKIIARWAAFAASNAEEGIENRVKRYRAKSHYSWARLKLGLEPDSSFSRESIYRSASAIDELARYTFRLKNFVDPDTVKPKLPEDGWTKVIKRETEWAMGYLNQLNQLQLTELFDEAYHSAASRYLYWCDAHNGYREGKRARLLLLMPLPLEVPMELYENDPEMLGLDVDKVYEPYEAPSLPYVPYVRIDGADGEHDYSLYRLKWPMK